MPQVTRAQLISDTREYMDAVGSSRWSDTFIRNVLNSVYDAEWSNILNSAPYYRFAIRQVATDSNGQIQLAALDSGAGDAQQVLYRVLSVSDGNVPYTETRFQDVPLATITNYLPTYPKLYYMTGTFMQTLPVSSGLPLYVAVNYKPTSLSDLSSDTVVIDYPNNSHLVLAYQAAYQLLLKGGAEGAAASNLKQLADEERATLLDDLRRQTINPTRMAYPDSRFEWGGG